MSTFIHKNDNKRPRLGIHIILFQAGSVLGNTWLLPCKSKGNILPLPCPGYTSLILLKSEIELWGDAERNYCA